MLVAVLERQGPAWKLGLQAELGCEAAWATYAALMHPERNCGAAVAPGLLFEQTCRVSLGLLLQSELEEIPKLVSGAFLEAA